MAVTVTNETVEAYQRDGADDTIQYDAGSGEVTVTFI